MTEQFTRTRYEVDNR